MKNFKYPLFVCLCVALLSLSVNALASKSCDGKKADQAKAADEAVPRQAVEEPAMAAIPPAEKEKNDTPQLETPPVKEDPAMAAIPGK